jgi:hypothetical protein
MNQDIINKQPEIIRNFRWCHMRGCTGMGYWSPVLSLSPDGRQRAYMPFPHWLMCDYHRDNIGLDDLVNGPMFSGEGAWERIQSAFTRSGKMAPQKEFAQLLWRPA